MNVTCAGGVIIGRAGEKEYLPSADEIFGALFEGRSDSPVDAAALRTSGIRFSDELTSPALLVTTMLGGDGEPEIRCQLAGKAGAVTVPAGTRGAFIADYVVTDGRWHPLPAGTLEAYARVRAANGVTSDILTLSQYVGLPHGSGEFVIEDRAAGKLAAGRLAPQLSESIPAGLAAKPYPYQQVGIRWLGYLARHGVGCILADEMGLGKTLEVIAALLGETAAGRGCNLVVCPATVLENWRRELDRFAPSLVCLVHAGSRRTGRATELSGPDVVVSSYETVAEDISLFRTLQWNLVVLDEAQNIRNPHARRTLRCKELRRRAGIAVTGTPMENRLQDLWSITDFAVPGYLGTERDFEARHADTEAGARELEPLVSAIMLRRRVRDVAQDLPKRIDVPVPLAMNRASATAYEEIREEALRNSPRAPQLTALVRLRMFCAHPWAAGKFRETADPVACSAKLERCLEIIEEIVGAGEKTLVFTSFNEVADIVDATVTSRFGIPAAQINGSVPVMDRQDLVDSFAAMSGPAVLVLNPRAAGTGLNITAANHVIHYNLEWNPAVEDQASARAHRRGQARPVTVHRLFYVDTVEEVISERMTRKRLIAEHAVVGGKGSEEDIADIVKALQRSPGHSA